MNIRIGITGVAVLLLLLVATAPAFAHKVIADAYPDGDLIEGEVGFSSGDPAAGAKIEVFTPDGEKLLETTTDADGVFSFKAVRHVDHVIKVNLGAGHVAEVVVSADDLPDSLGASASGPGEAAAATTPAAAPAAAAPASVSTGAAELRDMVREAVQHELRPLRRQLTEYENKVRWHDILGGLGFIVGITGIAAYALSRRRRA